MSGRDWGYEALPEADFVVVSPYLVPEGGWKKVNVGDGFILDSALKLLGARPRKVISSRAPISPEDLALINGSKMLLFAGANTLKSQFEIAPGFTPQVLKRIAPPVALFGIGHFGVEAAAAQPLDADSQALVRHILERFPFISVRCDASAAYLRSSVPDLPDRVLMTSCPVAYPVDGVDRGFPADAPVGTLVCTVTDRGAVQPQAKMLQAAAQLLPARRRVLALHQDHDNKPLHAFAGKLGFEVFVSPRYEDFIGLYAESDLHVGNRLHAHLKCLSLGVRSFLTPFDLRQQYFAQSLDFPLLTALPDPALAAYDFGRARARVEAARPTLERFLGAARTAIGTGP